MLQLQDGTFIKFVPGDVIADEIADHPYSQHFSTIDESVIEGSFDAIPLDTVPLDVELKAITEATAELQLVKRTKKK
jgi:hypothetical protein